MRVWERLLGVLDRYGKAAMVTVVEVSGSAPREAGARLIIQPGGGFSGTIGGGALEWRAIALGQQALARPEGPGFELRDFALGPELGQCCGGRVGLAIEAFGLDRRDEVAALADRERIGSFATEAFPGEGNLIRRQITAALRPGSAEWRDGVLREGFGESVRTVLLFGAGHVGRSLVLALAPLPFAVIWYDPRSDGFPGHVPENVEFRGLGDVAEALAGAPADAFVVVMTHSHGLDLAIIHAALASCAFPYVGLIGSATKRARFEKRLREAGVAEGPLRALVCPIGVAGIASKAPAAIAAATAAELLIRDEALARAETGPAAHEASPRRRGGRA